MLTYEDVRYYLSVPYIYCGVPDSFEPLINHYKTMVNGEVVYGFNEEVVELKQYQIEIPPEPTQEPVVERPPVGE